MMLNSRNGRFGLTIVAFGAGVTLALSGCAVEEPGATEDGAEITVGIVTSTTGAFATQGESFINGFEAGLDYLTDGTGIIDGTKINVEIRNDNGDPATGVAAAKELLGNGAKFIAGTTSSAIAVPVSEVTIQNGATYLSGVSGSSDLLAKHNNIFMTFGGSWQANEAILQALPDTEKLVYLGQDYEYGQDQSALLAASGEKLGVSVEKVLLPTGTQDFTAGVIQAKDLNPDLLYVGWQGDGYAQIYGALSDQNVYDSTKVAATVTSRGGIPLLADAAGDRLDDIYALSTYYEGLGGGNDMEKAMIAYAESTDAVVDYPHPSGFTAAQMVARSVEEAGEELDQADVSAALEGWTFESPIGELTVREEDHLLDTPMYSVRFEKASDGEYTAELITRYEGADLAPAPFGTLD